MARKMTRWRASINVEDFVNDFIEGKLTTAELAARYDRRPKEIEDILAGRTHRRIQAGIEKARANRREMTVRQLALLQDDAVAAMAKAVRGQADTVSLSAAREILNRSLDASEPGAPKAGHRTSPRQAPSAPAELAPDQKRRVLAELDGPPPES